MAVSKSRTENLVLALSGERTITPKAMFGAMCFYDGSKMIAMANETELYMRITDKGRAFIGQGVEQPPYDGAKPWFLMPADAEQKWLSRLASHTADDMPEPKPKKANPKK